jgi:hypothetical protein
MYIIDNVYISDDIAEEFFLCDLEACKGACCVEGESGAPLDKNETEILAKIYPLVKPYLTAKANREIKKQGFFVKDASDEYSTPTINQRECVYAFYDEKKILKCGIEQAYLDGKIDFQKPISCHLYPIRITTLEHEEALNYQRWHICNCAIKKGSKNKLPIYQFLKEPLIRKYGEKWYNELCQKIEKGEKAIVEDDDNSF